MSTLRGPLLSVFVAFFGLASPAHAAGTGPVKWAMSMAIGGCGNIPLVPHFGDDSAADLIARILALCPEPVVNINPPAAPNFRYEIQTTASFIHVSPYCPEIVGNGYPPNQGVCADPQRPPPGKNAGPETCCPPFGNPVAPGVGNKYQVDSDYRSSAAFPIEYRRVYNSLISPSPGPAGINWRHTFQRRIVFDPYLPATVSVFRETGRALTFRTTDGGLSFEADPDISDRIVALRDPANTLTGWQYHLSGGDQIEMYDAGGRLISVSDRAGVKHALTYSDGTVNPPNGGTIEGTSTPLPAGLLIRVQHDFGQTLTFGYNAAGRIVRLTDPGGGNYLYTYDSRGNLLSATYPDSRVRTYHYGE
ncbi:MAG TPA: DUF6531 domain-containing protein, partial [Burkholderiales bacterium]|nr:DUF6531 domain-containing protein [Burkholderiales bacterium]